MQGRSVREEIGGRVADRRNAMENTSGSERTQYSEVVERVGTYLVEGLFRNINNNMRE